MDIDFLFDGKAPIPRNIHLNMKNRHYINKTNSREIVPNELRPIIENVAQILHIDAINDDFIDAIVKPLHGNLTSSTAENSISDVTYELDTDTNTYVFKPNGIFTEGKVLIPFIGHPLYTRAFCSEYKWKYEDNYQLSKYNINKTHNISAQFLQDIENIAQLSKENKERFINLCKIMKTELPLNFVYNKDISVPQ